MKTTFFVIANIVLLPATLFAAESKLIPCDGPNCDFNALMLLVKNVITYLMIISVPLAAIAFSYAGFLYLTAAGDSGKVKQAHGIFTKVAIGFIMVLAAWVIVHEIVVRFVKPSEVVDFLGN